MCTEPLRVCLDNEKHSQESGNRRFQAHVSSLQTKPRKDETEPSLDPPEYKLIRIGVRTRFWSTAQASLKKLGEPFLFTRRSAKGVECSKLHEERWGSLTRIQLPGGSKIGLYQPKHPTAIGLT